MAEGNCTHYWIIDADNVGVCQYCGEVRDFNRLLRREGQLPGLKAKKGGSKGKRGKGQATIAKIPASARKSVAAKKRWQDPEYRAKHRAAHAPLPGQPNKKEELL